MSPARRSRVTLRTLHQNLGAVKVLLTTGLRAFPQDWPGEVLRTLRENNRLSEARFAQLDGTLREQAIETHTILRAVADGQRQLSADMRALIARIDALIRGRGNGAPTD